MKVLGLILAQQGLKLVFLKNGKAAGTDEIPAEALKVDPEMLAEMLYGVFEKIWEEEEITSEWKKDS